MGDIVDTAIDPGYTDSFANENQIKTSPELDTPVFGDEVTLIGFGR